MEETIVSEKQKLEVWRLSQDTLRLRLGENVNDQDKKKNEAYLLNKYDQFGDLPEFVPYSLVGYGYQPLTKWHGSDDADTMYFSPDSNREILSIDDFE